MKFDSNKQLKAACFKTFLLEKWRVVGGLNGERNFHVFYAILQSLSAQNKYEYELNNVADYHILTTQVSFLINKILILRIEMKQICFQAIFR